NQYQEQASHLAGEPDAPTRSPERQSVGCPGSPGRPRVDSSRAFSPSPRSVDSSLGGLSRSSTVASLDTDSTKSSGQSNNNSDTCAEFRIKYVGAIEKLKLSEGKSLEGPLDLINYIDVAQQDGKLPFVPLEEEFIMGVSKYGIKVSTSDQYDVLHRHALYLIIRMVCYDDGLGAGKSLLALKTTDASHEEYSLWVYQCSSLEQAQAICKVLATAFDSVLTSEKP
uniref:Integrin beta-1-binding protein 1 n=1 Tax=Sus scrofa TaxID=9823 RepID=A0A4X1UEE2_PIG